MEQFSGLFSLTLAEIQLTFGMYVSDHDLQDKFEFRYPPSIFTKLRTLDLINFSNRTVFRTFFLKACRYSADFWHISQSPAFLKAMHTKTDTFLISLKDGQIPSFASKRILYLQEYIQLVGD